MRYEKTFKEVISDILTANDALVEWQKNGCLNVVLPEETAKVLGASEYANLYFSAPSGEEKGIYVSYETDFFEKMGTFVFKKGRFSVAGYPDSTFNREKLSRLLPEKIIFNNAIFRLEKNEMKDVSYFLFFFKYIAVSDEKREGIISVLVNGLTGSTSRMDDYFPDNMEEISNHGGFTEHDWSGVIEPAYRFTSKKAREELDELVKSMERRLNRDADRICQYYETLKDEVREIMKKKEAEGQEIEKLSGKLDVIENEKRWKLQDMAMKYSLNIKLEPLAVVHIVTKTLVFQINVKRRLSSRLFPVSYNPILRKIDTLPCESCFAPEPPYYVCDEKLHIVCHECFGNCPVCGRRFCRACYNKCPRCKGNK